MFLSRRRRPEAATPQLLIGWTPPPSPLLPRPASAAGEPLDTAADGEKGRGGAEGDKAREGDKRGAEGEKESGLDRFACNICLETAQDPVVSYCGHLFCWEHLHEWFIVRPDAPTCPVCKAPCSADRVIPIFSGCGPSIDPRSKPAPPRPRPPPPPPPPHMPSPFAQIPRFAIHTGVFPFPGVGMVWSWPGEAGGATDTPLDAMNWFVVAVFMFVFFTLLFF